MTKRIVDVLLSAVALVVLSPLLIYVAWRIRRRLGSPILFKQMRPGIDGRPFLLVKFRTMTGSRDEDGNLLPDSDRMPKFGQFLRSSSLDELPELWNVFKGDMSIVGPRPLLLEYLDLYTTEQSRRHDVRPGITGWAQVNGRNNLSWDEKFTMDVWYVDNYSMWLDMKIVFRTFGKVVKGDGIAQAGHVTMEPFRGSSD